jgi:hypothetical protein
MLDLVIQHAVQPVLEQKNHQSSPTYLLCLCVSGLSFSPYFNLVLTVLEKLMKMVVLP